MIKYNKLYTAVNGKSNGFLSIESLGHWLEAQMEPGS